jgi:hypothetical protein
LVLAGETGIKLFHEASQTDFARSDCRAGWRADAQTNNPTNPDMKLIS